MPLRWLLNSLRVRGQHTEHPFWFVWATSHHSDALLHKADWAASHDTVLQNTPPGPCQPQLIVAGCDRQLDLRPPTMQTLSTVAQQAQLDHALTHRGENNPGCGPRHGLRPRPGPHRSGNQPLGAAGQRRPHAGAVQAPHLEEAAIRRRLSPAAVPPLRQSGGDPGHMHVGCAHSGLLWPHFRQAAQEAAGYLPPGDKALWVASWRSAGAKWTEVFCYGLVPEAAQAQLRRTTRCNPPGGTSVDVFLQHMLRLGDFVWELRNQRLEQLPCPPLSAAAGCNDGSPRRRTTAPPLLRAQAGASWPPSAS